MKAIDKVKLDEEILQNDIDFKGKGNIVNLSMSSRNLNSLYKSKKSLNGLKHLGENLRKIKELNPPPAFRNNLPQRNFNIKITHKYNDSNYLEPDRTPKVHHKQSISESKAYNRTVDGARNMLNKNMLNRSSNLVSINQSAFSPTMMNDPRVHNNISSSHHDYSSMLKQAKSPYSNHQSLGLSVKDIPGLKIDPDDMLKPGSSPFGGARR